MQLTIDFLRIFFSFSLQPSRVAPGGGGKSWGRKSRIMMDLDFFLGYCLGI